MGLVAALKMLEEKTGGGDTAAHLQHKLAVAVQEIARLNDKLKKEGGDLISKVGMQSY